MGESLAYCEIDLSRISHVHRRQPSPPAASPLSSLTQRRSWSTFNSLELNFLCRLDFARCICIPTALPVNLAAVEPVAYQLPTVNVAAEAAHTLHADVVAAAQHADSDANEGGAGSGVPRRDQIPSSSSSSNRPIPARDAAKEAEQRRAQETERALEELRSELRERRLAAMPPPVPRPHAAELRAAPTPAWFFVLVAALLIVAAQKLLSLH